MTPDEKAADIEAIRYKIEKHSCHESACGGPYDCPIHCGDWQIELRDALLALVAKLEGELAEALEREAKKDRAIMSALDTYRQLDESFVGPFKSLEPKRKILLEALSQTPVSVKKWVEERRLMEKVVDAANLAKKTHDLGHSAKVKGCTTIMDPLTVALSALEAHRSRRKEAGEGKSS